MKKFILILIALTGLGTSANAQLGNQDIRDAGRVIKSKEIQKPDPYGKLNSAGVLDKIIVIKVDLCEKGTGERFVKKTVIGFISSSTGSKLNTFDNDSQLLYQNFYGGYFSEDEY